MRIVFAGCVAQQEGEQLLRRVPEVDLVMGREHVVGGGLAGVCLRLVCYWHPVRNRGCLGLCR